MLVNIEAILKPAQENGFAVPAFNISSNMLLRAALEACEAKHSPVIIAIHPDELAFVRNSFVEAVLAEAHRSPVPVCIHLDHGSTIEQALTAIRHGFTSVMIDCSALPFSENIRLTKSVVDIAHPVGVTVEAELGTIGAVDARGEAGADNIVYTDPADVEVFVAKTGIDALAIAVGTAHGLYPKGMTPKLRMDLLAAIRAKTDVPLVLHGGSDNPDAEIQEAVRLGVCKINISSDIKVAFYRRCRQVLADETLREPNAIYPACIDAAKQVMYHKIELFNSANAADFY